MDSAVNESPTTKGSLLYPGIEILQTPVFPSGRGTQTPFEDCGAPWLKGDAVAPPDRA